MTNWFVFLSVFEELYDKVIEECLKDSNIKKPAAVLYSRGQESRVNKDNYSRLDRYSSIVEHSLFHEPDLDFISYLEDEYAISTLSLVVFADRHVGYEDRYTYKQKLALIELTFRYAIEIADSNEIKFAWFESTSDLLSYILYLVFKKAGVEIRMIVAEQLPGKIAFSSNINLTWNGMEEEIEALNSTNPATEDEISAAKHFLHEYRNKLPTPNTYSRFSFPKITFIDIRNFLRWTQDYFGDKNNPLIKSPRAVIIIKFRRIFRAIKAKLLFSSFNKEDIGDYVFFPLHFQPEMTTLVCAPFFVNQVATIENIARSLPAGVKLVVKEHHGMIGRRRISDYLDIKKNWNVDLIRPEESAMEIIKYSKAVVTICGTVGLEGVLLGKPVVTLVRTGYDACRNVFRAVDVPSKDLHEIIDRALKSKVNEKNIIDFYTGMNRIMLDGEGISFFHPTYSRKSLSNENIKKIYSLIHSELKRTVF